MKFQTSILKKKKKKNATLKIKNSNFRNRYFKALQSVRLYNMAILHSSFPLKK